MLRHIDVNNVKTHRIIKNTIFPVDEIDFVILPSSKKFFVLPPRSIALGVKSIGLN